MKRKLHEPARLLALFALCLLLNTANAQKWGRYTLVATQNTTAKIIDTSNVVYKTWTLSGTTGYSAYMLEGGVLLRSVTTSNSVFSGGGMHGRVQKIDWNGNILWDYTHSTTTYCGHHDIHPMPNGNVLMIAYELKSATETSAAGCSVSKVLWPDKIIEIQPTGPTTGTIVWEWHVWDHLVQNVAPTKANYQASVLAHPELININYNNSSTSLKDWMHCNGLDYNAELDQITFSSHNLNEVYVIDHSTTTAEAASHSGGNSGKGGDILYRWGNPAAYGATGTANFNVVHDAHWIPSNCPRAGSLAAFNNGATTTASAADIFYPPYNGYNYSYTAGTAYAPSVYDKRIVMNGKTTNQGNSQQLPNGNTIYAVALSGNLYEVDSNGTTVWSYSAGSQLAQTFRYSNCYINGPAAVTASSTSTSICAGSSVSLSSSASGISAISYAWTSDVGGFTSTSQNPTASPTTTTVYTLTATSNGCSTSKTVTVVVVPKPVTGSITGSSTVVPSALENYTVPNTSGSAYNWIVSGGTVSSGANTNAVSITWSGSPGTGSVKVVETTASGCKGDTVTLAVTRAGSVSLSVTPPALTYTNAAGVQKIYITANTSWTATSNAAWATLSKGSGTGTDSITLSSAANPTTSARTATIVITAGNLTQTVAVSQDSSAPVFIVTPLSLVFTKAGSSQKITINSNSSWTVSSNQTWLVPAKLSGSNSDSFMVTASANTDTISRSGILFFTSGAITQSVPVKQDSTPVFITTSPTALSFSNTASGVKVYVSSSVSWTVNASQPWVSLSKTSGTGNDTITVSVTANGTASSRSASLSFAAGSASYILPLTQASTAPFLTATPNLYTIINTGQTAGLSVSSNVSWTASVNVSWLTLSKTLSSGNDSIYLTAEPNGSIHKRSAVITLTTGSITQTITLTQDSTPAYLVVDRISMAFNQPAGTDVVSIATNTVWSAVADQSWITFNKTSGTGNDTLKVTVAANTSYTLRSATITIAVGSIVKTISVLQEALPVPDSLSVNTTQIHAVYSAASYTINVKSNRSWVVTSLPSWITVSPMSGTGDSTLTIAVTSNTASSGRTGTITITGGNLTAAITVSQDSMPVVPDVLTVNEDTINVSSSGNVSTIAVASNRLWTVSSSQAWVTPDKTSGTGNQSVVLTTSANTGVARTATVTFTAGSVQKVVHVIQAAPVTGLDDADGNATIKVYPNPSNGIVYIQPAAGSSAFEVIIADVSGKIMARADNVQTADLSSYASGVYYVMITSEGNSTISKKIILIK